MLYIHIAFILLWQLVLCDISAVETIEALKWPKLCTRL